MPSIALLFTLYEKPYHVRVSQSPSEVLIKRC